MMSLETIEFWYWWVAAIAFVVIEIFAPGTVALWMGVSAGWSGCCCSTLVSVMEDLKAPHSARVAAANGLLDRGHGKAVHHIEAEVTVYDSLSLADKQALLAALDALDGDEEGAQGGPAPTHH